jgi:ABC-type oligopeptide transport system ATPase subunit
METILKIDNIEKYYGNKSNMTKAIDGISFDVEAGEYPTSNWQSRISVSENGGE